MASASWAWYKSMLVSQPLLTKATTSAVLMAASDICCQHYETSIHRDIISKHGPDANLQMGCPAFVTAPPPSMAPPGSTTGSKLLQYDWTRTSHVAVTGFTLSGPISHAWYQGLEMVVKTNSAVWGISFRLLLDAAIFSPIAVAAYFVWRTALEGKGVQDIVQKLEYNWRGALQASWSFWPAANVVNFALVPVSFRVLYNNSLSVFWNGYLSHINSQRLESVVEERILRPEHFVPREGAQRSDAEEKALETPCVCSHCRSTRA
jgi:protein Mpv17